MVRGWLDPIPGSKGQDGRADLQIRRWISIANLSQLHDTYCRWLKLVTVKYTTKNSLLGCVVQKEQTVCQQDLVLLCSGQTSTLQVSCCQRLTSQKQWGKFMTTTKNSVLDTFFEDQRNNSVSSYGQVGHYLTHRHNFTRVTLALWPNLPILERKSNLDSTRLVVAGKQYLGSTHFPSVLTFHTQQKNIQRRFISCFACLQTRRFATTNGFFSFEIVGTGIWCQHTGGLNTKKEVQLDFFVPVV